MKTTLFPLIILSCTIIGCGSNIDNVEQESADSHADANADSYANFNDYVTVDFKPAEVTSVDDGHPDYSGWYINEYEQCEPSEYLHLQKEPTGTYSCSIWSNRLFALDGTAKYVNDNVLSFEGENEFGGNGTIKINEESATVILTYIDGQDKDYEKTFKVAIPEPDLSNYLGEYTYTDDAGNKTVFHVENDCWPEITVSKNDKEEKIFEHTYLSSDQIYVDEFTDNNGNTRELLIAKHQPNYYKEFIQEDDVLDVDSPRYLIIDNNEKQSKIYYKTMKPEILH